VARLNAARPPALLGYASKLAELAREQLAGRLSITPRSVTSVSEVLTTTDRAVIERAFTVPVTDSFVCTEGLVGHSEPGESVMSFASDMCLSEPVDDDNNPVPPGMPSAKVLITNLHNLTQPLIRYELTDRFTRTRAAASWPAKGWSASTRSGRPGAASTSPAAPAAPSPHRHWPLGWSTPCARRASQRRRPVSG